MKAAGKGFAVLVAVVAAVSFSPLTSSAFMGEDGAQPAGRHFKKMATELGLSAQQQQDVKAVFAKNRPLAEPLMKQLKAEHRALRTVVQTDAVDDAAIRAQSAKLAAVEADLAVQRAHVGQQIRAILTPEQLQTFKGLQVDRDKGMDDRRGRHPRQPQQDK